jgi:streptogramin lyase
MPKVTLKKQQYRHKVLSVKLKSLNEMLGNTFLQKSNVCRHYGQVTLFLIFSVVQFGLMGSVGNTADAATVWVANWSSETVTELSLKGKTLGNFAVGCNPDAIAIGKSGDVWVTCINSNTVTKLSPSGYKMGSYSIDSSGARAIAASTNVWVAVAPQGGAFGTLPTGDSYMAELNSSGKKIGLFSTAISYPSDIAIDKSNDVWVANLNNVTELSPDGKVIGSFTAGPRPTALAIDASGNVWVVNVDPANGRGTVVELNPLGKQIGNISAGSYSDAIAIGNNGNIWIANDGNGTAGIAYGDSNVTELSPNGKTIGTFAAGSLPWSIAIDGNNNVWVSNNDTHGEVTELNSRGKEIGVFSVGSAPQAIAIDRN